MRDQCSHVVKNKLSEKMGRRDVQFYDLYKKHRFEEDVQNMKNKGFEIDGVLSGHVIDPVTKEKGEEITDANEPLYGDIEVDDFDKLFRHRDLISDQYGESIKVKL